MVRFQKFWLLIFAAIAMCTSLGAQDTSASKPELGIITGTVTDVNGDTVIGASVVLQDSNHNDLRKVVSDDNGFFQFAQLEPGPYRVTITAESFADWTSTELALNTSQY